MIKKVAILLVFCMLFSFCACGKKLSLGTETSTDVSNTTTTKKELTLEEKAAMAVSQMTIEEKIGQMLIITYPGSTFTEELSSIVSTVKPGGFIMMSDNISSYENTSDFIYNLQTNSDIPMIISIDQEGGVVQRLSGLSNPSPTKIPKMSKLGKTNNKELAYEVGGVMAKEMSAVGINLTFAPVVDILSNPNNQVIGSRSFGNNPQIVSKMATAVANGLEDNGVTATYKHFPGHGDTSTDSHSDLPIIKKTKDELWKNELIPFKNAIDNDARIIMVGHIALPKITGDNTPASLSKTIITDLLKNEMGYKGLVVTDALNMGALTKKYSYEEMYIKAIDAGVDLLLMPNDPQEAVEAIKNNVDESKIDAAVTKILTFKYNYIYTHTNTDESCIGCDDHKDIINQIKN